MSQIGDIFSTRLVVADFYLEKPILGLDLCYSEFRGKEIKKVPIIRIFGSNGNGQKTCMHVHGVFPYFYIPYESKDFETFNKAIYQVALSLDKALNVSLGQGNSTAQHVFKIQLVKGIPFYGYHRNEHQYLKIFMFNPRFVRRAANLFQNGAILGKVFHPHESHVPFVLQFMIDYNLYGMSFLHVPLEVVKFRCENENDVVPYSTAVKEQQVLDTNLVKKQTCSALEVDIGASFILNRFQLIVNDSTNKHGNPGVEAIWNDERIRRQKLIASCEDDEEKIKKIPVLEKPPTQERPNVKYTESDTFYRTGLQSKLMITEQSLSNSGSLLDQTLNCTAQALSLNFPINSANLSNKEMRRTFNLKKLLANSVYPEECVPDEQLVNASRIENHLLDKSTFLTSSSKSTPEIISEELNTTIMNESDFLENTIVDEDLLGGFTQEQHVPLDASLRFEDMELLDVLQQLEDKHQNEQQIDLDSSLAALSQTHKNFELTPDLLDKETIAVAENNLFSDNESDSENEHNSHLLDFSIAMDDIDELLLKLSQSQPTVPQEKVSEPSSQIAQLDGADDLLQRTPEKLGKTLALVRQQVTPPKSPKTPKRYDSKRSPVRSPRTPKSSASAKYTPLPIVIQNRSTTKSPFQKEQVPFGFKAAVERLSFDAVKNRSRVPISLEKKLAITKMRRKTISSAKELIELENHKVSKQVDADAIKPAKRSSRKESVNLDKTHVTCSLTPRRRRSERLLKFCNVDEVAKDPENTMRNNNSKSLEKTTKIKMVKEITKGKSIKARAVKKVLVKIPRKDLQKLAAEFEQEKLKENLEKCSKTLEPLAKNRTRKNVHPLKEKESDDEIQKETRIECSEPLGSIDQNGKNLDTHTPEFQNSHNSPTNEDCAPDNNANNIRRNLSELARLFQNFDGNREQARDTNLSNQTSKSIRNSQNNLNKDNKEIDELDEDIAASDNESSPRVLSSKRTRSLKRSRLSLNSRRTKKSEDETKHASTLKSALKTPKSSLCDFSMSIDSPSVFSEQSSPASMVTTPTINEDVKDIAELTSKESNFVILRPLDSPPTRESTLKACEKLQLYEHEFQQPFYSNPDDITKAKEVSFTVLQIAGNKLSDCAEFESVLGKSIDGLANWRRRKLLEMGGQQAMQRYRTTERLREFFATQQRVIIETHLKPPTRHDAKVWVKAREILQAKMNNDKDRSTRLQIEADSPIKIRRQKITMMFNDETGAGNDDADDMDISSCSLTLTPLTPATPYQTQDKTCLDNSEQTPLTTSAKCRVSSASSVLKRSSKRIKTVRASLNEKLKAAATSDDVLKPADECSESLSLSQKSNHSSNESSSVCSQVVLAELDRSSFVKQLKPGGVNKHAQHDVSFGLTSASLNNTFGFKVNLENLHQAKSDIECNYLTSMVLEVFVPTRQDLYPNPEYDEIRCIFYAIDNNVPTSSDTDSTPSTSNTLPSKACGYILVNDCQDITQSEGKIHGIDADIEVKIVKTEIEAIEALLELCARWDADIYAGYEIEMSSWGYIIDRAKFLCLNIAPLLSRVPTQKSRDFFDEDREQLTDLDVETKICGRIVLDVWRLMRSEIALTSYTFENVMYHILHKRCPWHSYRDLTTWFASPCSRWIVLEYYLERVRGILAILDQLDLLGRTSEMAKLIGIQFYEVLSRGSQFRVESMMLRIAKPRNLVPLSPSVQQRAHMRAPEYLPLILEPQSRFYADPVIVLDFQSLYPSVIIGYNYCFSTCLGRVEHLGQSTPFEFGASQLRVSPKMLQKLLDEDLVNISPCGVVFVKQSVREGILPRMLTEILDTRQMVKQSMKLHKSNSALQRILHSRQLGLKLMANVTYGYTAANFSGRMPAVEVGDSVVAKGRETLERTIKMVEANEKWGVKVVYGDTDSLFVQVPGRDREQAFQIGEEIAAAATKDNPHPIKLKLEKVYQPCILQTKKRYVGYMYETPDQTDPIYEAKGIETVRRDGCPAVAKMLEKVLRILFESADVSQVKQYVCRQFTKLLSGRANLQDLIFAKEFRGLNGYKPTACVPALELTRKWIQSDPRRIPRRGERVPFIITNGPPGVPLIRLIRTPHEVLADGGLKINAIYYITKAIIPPLNRCLLLIGADVNEWFASLPRRILMTPALSTGKEIITTANQQKKSTISQYFSTTNCIIDCGRQTKDGICNECTNNATRCVVTLQTKIAKIERAYNLTQHICQACCGRVGSLKCGSLDCPVLYVFEGKRRDLEQIEHFRKLLAKF